MPPLEWCASVLVGLEKNRKKKQRIYTKTKLKFNLGQGALPFQWLQLPFQWLQHTIGTSVSNNSFLVMQIIL